MHYWENGIGATSGFVMASGTLAFSAFTVVTVVWALRSAWYSSAIVVGARQLGAGDVERILAGRSARGGVDPDHCRTALAVLSSRSS